MSKESAIAVATNGITPPVLAGTPGLQAEVPKELDSTRFAHIAKKEAEIVKTREQLKAEKEAFEKERSELLGYKKRVTEFEELREKDKIAAMKNAGFTDTDILNYFASLEDTSTPEEKAAKAAQNEIQKFKDEQAKAAAEIKAKDNARVLSTFKNDIIKEVGSDKEKYEYCNYHGPMAEELIYETVAQVLEDSKELITIKEATEIVENYYEEQDKAMNNLKKRKPKEEAVLEAKQKIEELKAEVSPGQPGSSNTKTLSNKTGASIASTVTRKETPSEKRQRLISQLGSYAKK